MWEYAGEAPTQAPELHAKLLRQGDARTIKIIAVTALLDRGCSNRSVDTVHTLPIMTTDVAALAAA